MILIKICWELAVIVGFAMDTDDFSTDEKVVEKICTNRYMDPYFDKISFDY